MVRAGLSALLAAQPGFTVAGEAADGDQAVRQAAWLEPDLVLMDLQMGEGIDGLEATRRINALPTPPAVVILTTYDSDADILRAQDAGARGYLLKETPPQELFHALREVAAGTNTLSPRLLRRPALLSQREIEILELLAAGRSNRELARAMFISEATVKTHLAHIYDKLGVDSRIAAVRTAVDRRLIRL